MAILYFLRGPACSPPIHRSVPGTMQVPAAVCSRDTCQKRVRFVTDFLPWANAALNWHTPRFCAGYSGTSQNLKSAGTDTHEQSAGSWRCDETYIKVKGRWTYLYRAVDKQGRTVDFLLSAKRDVAAAKRFFQKAMKGNGTPRVITLDAYAASHRAVRELKAGRSPNECVSVRAS